MSRTEKKAEENTRRGINGLVETIDGRVVPFDVLEKIFHNEEFSEKVALFNPMYSAKGKGLASIEKAFLEMGEGYAAVLIQENA